MRSQGSGLTLITTMSYLSPSAFDSRRIIGVEGVARLIQAWLFFFFFYFDAHKKTYVNKCWQSGASDCLGGL